MKIRRIKLKHNDTLLITVGDEKNGILTSNADLANVRETFDTGSHGFPIFAPDILSFTIISREPAPLIVGEAYPTIKKATK